MPEVVAGSSGTCMEEVESVLEGASFSLSSEANDAIAQGREKIEALLRSGKPIYGVNTGFGRLAGTIIPSEDLALLQKNLLLSHACGTGEPFPVHLVRAMMFLRVASLAQGRSGVRAETVSALVKLGNSGYTPVVPSQGSLGASGDLAPLSSMCLPILGEGECFDPSGRIISGAEAMKAAGIAPVELQAKEGLALINGTQVLTAVACSAYIKAKKLMKAADAAAAITLEALLGTDAALDAELVGLRPHPGAAASAAFIREQLKGSEIIHSHSGCGKVQDAYSLRCTPQVHGASRDALEYVGLVLDRELKAVTDNPLLMEDGRAVSGGNFHGQPVALAADHLKIAAAELANISERRTERLLNPDLSGLPAFLAPSPGLNSGLMIAQYTAAALVSENKVLAHPASVDSISVSGAQEDHVSMGATASRQALAVVENSIHVLAVELASAVQAHRLLDRGRMGTGTEKTFNAVAELFPPLERDRHFAAELQAIHELIERGIIG
ncbi:histidine ammonia-lyase [Candidatus Fermentibacteria bacterium]|nr:MAG: histidine ammonia-lyase [Candidatus Fermentibacteria bacterium]